MSEKRTVVNLTLTPDELAAFTEARNEEMQGGFNSPLSNSDMVHYFLGMAIGRWRETHPVKPTGTDEKEQRP